MNKDGVTGQKRMATLHGKPAEGMLWCSGFEIEPHQVPAEQIPAGRCRCSECLSRYNEQYRARVPRTESRSTRAGGPVESDDRYVPPGRVPPGNDGRIPLKSWGYVPPEQHHRFDAGKYADSSYGESQAA